MRERHLVECAKSMRQEMTEPERRLWQELRAKRLGGAKFRRQQVIGPYIADFACREPMLVVEVDGETHSTQHVYDGSRSRFLEERGYRVLRFSNLEVMTNLEGILLAIGQAIGLPLTPALSPEGEREHIDAERS